MEANATFFGQLRDLYADIHIDTFKVHRFRVGLSKLPYGWENMQSSQNRIPLDRTDPINAAWNWGEGPGLNKAQTVTVTRPLHGGYIMAMYKFDTNCYGIVNPFAR